MSTTLLMGLTGQGGRSSDAFDLARDETLRIPLRGRAVVVRVERGVVLVTREGDVEDHVLEPGMELRVSGPGLVVAWALEPSTMRVTGEAPLRRAA